MTKAVVINAQRFRSLLAAVLRVLRHHYFTFVTAGVLSGIVVVIATSSSFNDREQASGTETGAAQSLWPTPTQGPFATRGRSLIYYIVESNEQAITMERAMRSDVTYSEMNGSRQDFGRVIYLNPRTPMDEANVALLLNDAVALAPHGGYVVTIIDLRE